MKNFFHFFKAMWAALIAYKRGIYFVAYDANAFWQLSLHSKFFPGLADFDLKDPENGSMHSRANIHVWDKVEEDDYTGWRQRYVRNFDKDAVIRELVIVKKLLKEERPDLGHREIYEMCEEYRKDQETLRGLNPDKSYMYKECLI